MAYASALALIANAIGASIAPPSTQTPSQWAAKHLVLVEGPRAGQVWDPAQAPYICAIIDGVFCGHHTKGTVRKSAQVGYTQGITAIAGWIVSESPARALIVLPTSAMALSLNREKLQPAIDATPLLKKRVLSMSRRESMGSSALYKAFPGGSISITGANSAPELQMRTIKFALCDEIDQWPKDLEGQGSPMSMVDGRQIAFHATRDYRKLQGGTPTLKGGSLVDSEFEAGDQRFQHLPCPHCGDRIRLLFGGFADGQGGTGLRFNREHPYDAHYVAQCCGARIEHWQKSGMISAAMDLPEYGFIPDKQEPGRHPSWHIDSISSNFTTWDKIAETYVAAGDDPQKLKSFYNHWLGLAYEEKSDAPDWTELYKRRENYGSMQIPADALLVTMGVDVQKRGLYMEIVGWTPDLRSYTIHAGYIAAGSVEKVGDTSDPDDPCWKKLSDLHEAPLNDAFGGARRIDATAVDCKFNSPVVYDWVRRHHMAYAVRTIDGWGRPALSAPIPVDFDWRGKRIRRGAQQWQSGSYNLKALFYTYLRRDLEIIDGEVKPPRGYCHFGTFLDERYFRQLTAEYLGLDKAGRRVWKEREPDNHWLDCRIMNMALAFGAQFDIRNRTDKFWTDLAHERGAAGVIEPLLSVADPFAATVAETEEIEDAGQEPPPTDNAVRPPSDDGWGFSGGSWL